MTKQSCEKLVYELFEKYKLKDYKFEWMKKLTRWRTAGSCSWVTKTIKLQPTYVEKNEIEIIKNTILHEIAHALTPKHGHNKFWKRKAIERRHCNRSN